MVGLQTTHLRKKYFETYRGTNKAKSEENVLFTDQLGTLKYISKLSFLDLHNGQKMRDTVR